MMMLFDVPTAAAWQGRPAAAHTRGAIILLLLGAAHAAATTTWPARLTATFGVLPTYLRAGAQRADAVVFIPKWVHRDHL